MPLPALASLDDLDARSPGGLDVDDETRAQAYLEDASAWMRAEARQTWVDENGDLLADRPDILVGICCTVVRRVLDNPEGVVQSNVDGVSETLSNASIDTYFTAGERAQLQRLRPRRPVGTLGTTRGPLETRRRCGPIDATWAPVAGGGEPIPMLGDPPY